MKHIKIQEVEQNFLSIILIVILISVINILPLRLKELNSFITLKLMKLWMEPIRTLVTR
jgi:hypothetical protein